MMEGSRVIQIILKWLQMYLDWIFYHKLCCLGIVQFKEKSQMNLIGFFPPFFFYNEKSTQKFVVVMVHIEIAHSIYFKIKTY